MSLLTPLLQLSFSAINDGSFSTIPVGSLMAITFRITYILLSFMLNIFAFVVIRQVKVMNDTVTTVLGPILHLISIIFFAFTVFLSVLAVTRL